MSITIHEPPEPLTDAYHDSESSQFAQSSAYRLLVRDLERYCLRQVGGRSFLISGHRGSGKTTMIRRAIQEIRDRSEEVAGLQRPILVALQGPSLLPEPGSKTAGGEDTSDSENTGEPEDQTQHALEQITLALYRALVREFSECYHRRAEAGSSRPLAMRSERLELASQFRLALDGAPGPSVLRDYWSHVDALESGVLFSRDWEEDSDQGMRELTVLSAAAQAFRLLSGKEKIKESGREELTDHEKKVIEVTASAKEFMKPVVGIVSGAAIGAGMFSQGMPAISAAIAAVLTTLTATATLTRSSTVSRNRTRQTEYTFLLKRDSSTLRRELPTLVERVHRTGLAPVFVVDEMDKIDDLEERMESIVKQLKHFVAEGAFFAFLTDRDYFELLREKGKKEAYPKEHTYFTDRLFVLHRPHEWHEFLRPSDDIRKGVLRLDRENEQEERARELLSYLILHRARMHSVDVRRELSRLRGESGEESIAAREVGKDLSDKFTIMIQLAVEVVLSAPDLRKRLEQDPNFAQPVYDALYYASREWANGHKRLQLTKDEFAEYLYLRMKPNKSTDDVSKFEDKTTEDLIEDMPIGAVDFEFLLDCAARLVKLIAEPERLLEALEALSDASSTAIDCVPHDQTLLAKVGDDEKLYDWKFDAFGNEIDAIDPPSKEALLAFDRNKEFIEEVDGYLRTINLSLEKMAELRVLSSYPSWEEVRGAFNLVAEKRTGPTPQLHAELDRVETYSSRLQHRGPILASCIAYGSHLSASDPSSDGLSKGIGEFAEGLKLASRATPQSITSAIQKYGEDSEITVELANLGLSKENSAKWCLQVSTLLSTPPGTPSDQ